MAAFIYLCYKSNPQVGANVVNGVTAALVNSVSGADALLNAVLAANVAFTQAEGQSEATSTQDAFPAGYFDTAVAASASAGVPASGNLHVDGDAYIFPGPNAAPIFVAGTAYTPVG